MLDWDAGSTLMEAIRDRDVQDQFALCGGHCSCATCHVYVDDRLLAGLAPMSAEESELLDGSGQRRPNSRLSCQVAFADMAGEARVEIAPED